MNTRRVIKTKEDILEIENAHKKIIKSKSYPNIHLTAFSGLINDPNGLHFDGDKVHIYYQWSPFEPNHLMKHWGHYTTKDFITFTHEEDYLAPSIEEDKHGCFSGSAVKEGDEWNLYYTGNVEFGGHDDNRTAYTIKIPSNDLNKKEVVIEADLEQFTGHFRDPYFANIDNRRFVLHGVKDKALKGHITIHEFKNNKWEYLGLLKINPDLTAYMVECPAWLNIDNQNVIICSLEGQKVGTDFSKSPIFMTGDLDIANLDFNNVDLTPIDYGRDFYAPQVFKVNGEDIMIAWFGMSDFNDHISSEDGFANALTLPRVLKMKDGKIHQTVVDSVRNLIGEEVKGNDLPDTFILKANSMEDNSKIAFNGLDGSFDLTFTNGTLTLDWSNSKVLNNISTKGEVISTKRHIKLNSVNNVEIWRDKSFIEIFVNDGLYTFTQRIEVGDIKSIDSDLDLTINKVNNIQIKGWW